MEYRNKYGLADIDDFFVYEFLRNIEGFDRT